MIGDSPFAVLQIGRIQGDRKSSDTDQNEANVEMQKCGADEVIQLSWKRVTMKDNPAYVDINLHVH